MEERISWEGATRLDDSTEVARAVLDERWIRGGVRPGAFLRRDRDEDGVTVTNPQACTSEQLCNTFARCFGVLHIEVGKVRNLGLDVQATDPASHVCDHASITGLPYKSQDPGLAEFLAGQLARLARLVWSPTT